MANRPTNLHELLREALDGVRKAFPDRVIDVEHRGDGDADFDPDSLASALGTLAGAAITCLGDAESLWLRSSGADIAKLAIVLRWRGLAIPEDVIAEVATALAACECEIELSEEAGEQVVRLALPRFPPPAS